MVRQLRAPVVCNLTLICSTQFKGVDAYDADMELN